MYTESCLTPCGLNEKSMLLKLPPNYGLPKACDAKNITIAGIIFILGFGIGFYCLNVCAVRVLI